MRFFAHLALSVLAVSTSALVIPSATESSHEVDVIAGSIAQLNATVSATNRSEDVLEIEYEKLEVLKTQLYELQHQVLNQEREILDLIKRDFDICSGLTCYLQTALRKAPDFFQLFKTHFRHHSHSSTGSYHCPWSTNSSRSDESSPSASSTGASFNFAPEETISDDYDPFDFHGADDTFDSSVENPFSFDEQDHSSPFDFHSSGSEEFTVVETEDESPIQHDELDSSSEGDAFDFNAPSYSSYNPTQSTTASPAATTRDISTYSTEPPSHTRPPFQLPHPAPRHRYYKLILAAGGLVISITIFAVLFKALRIYCANPRIRAERAARIEECRTRREYRRAACRHKIRQFLSRFSWRSRSQATDDYEEKRAMLRRTRSTSQPVVDSHVVGANINALRRIHERIEHLILAEEGRCPVTARDQSQQDHSQTEEVIASSSRSIRSIRTTTTLPPYAPPPPQYSQELDSDMHVIGGFRRTPTQSSATITSSASSFILDDDVTESSVVDCRSRLSIETDTDADTRSVLHSVGMTGINSSYRPV